uniref:Uncharacterized protein n=1 Tax=Leersia perrieri TaxID=77586 RepID=A0A0D9XIK5_9ORYZ
MRMARWRGSCEAPIRAVPWQSNRGTRSGAVTLAGSIPVRHKSPVALEALCVRREWWGWCYQSLLPTGSIVDVAGSSSTTGRRPGATASQATTLATTGTTNRSAKELIHLLAQDTAQLASNEMAEKTRGKRVSNSSSSVFTGAGSSGEPHDLGWTDPPSPFNDEDDMGGGASHDVLGGAPTATQKQPSSTPLQHERDSRGQPAD